MPVNSKLFFLKDRGALRHLILILWTLLLFPGCVAGPLMDARKAFYSHRPLDAVNALSDATMFAGRDRLLLLMEKGLILHHAGEYEKSIHALLQASKVMEEQEVISISQQAASFVTTEWVTEYKGEYSERLWVHTYLMMNFLLIHKYESALVEAKQALKVLEKHPEPLSGDYFTRALIALCHENLGEINDAYIEYKKLAELMRDPSPVAPVLCRLGRRLGFADEVEEYERFIPKTHLNEGMPSGELILFAGLGNAPVKVPHNIIIPPSIRFSFPKYETFGTPYAQITVLDSTRRPLPAFISVTTDINGVADASLQARASKIMAKETARAAIKETMSRAVERKNQEIVGVLLRTALLLLEEPDTRCWQTLPASLTLLRVPISGNSDIKIITRSGGRVEEIMLPKSTLSPSQKNYCSVRFTD